jgi:adenylate cyclase
VEFEARGRFAVPPERLWPLVSDTQRLNRALGLPPMRFTVQPLPTGGSRVVGEHALGDTVVALLRTLFPDGPRWRGGERLARRLSLAVVRWIEHPFEWEAPRRYAVLREYSWSPFDLFPFRSFRGGVELLPQDGGGVEVIAFAAIRPRHLPGALLSRFLLGPRNVRGVIRLCHGFEQYLLGRRPHPFPQPAPAPGSRQPSHGVLPRGSENGPAHAERALSAQVGWQALAQAGLAPHLVARLRGHLLEAPDEAVTLMRPFELADTWGTDRRATLAMFLHATTAGLLRMSWTVLCPNCRLPTAEYRALPDLQQGAHCDTCNISFDTALDRQVEVRFSPVPAIRQVDERPFCSGGPMSTPHVVAQATVGPGETGHTLHLVLRPGTYRLRSPRSRSPATLDVAAAGMAPAAAAGGLDPAAGAGAAGEVCVTLADDAIRPPLLGAAPGSLRLRAGNRTGRPALLVVERAAWPDTAATAAMVGTLQEFRDLFDSQALAPGLQLAVERLAFLFTDLSGSTALYQAYGQARAFRLVQDHFRILREAVVAHGGAVVKTIGDAVMAAFPTGAHAVGAALAMQLGIRRLEVAGPVDPARLLKVGIHEGPCIAVGANGRLDYFGTTINVAARVEHESQGGEVVMTAEVYEEPTVAERLRRAGLQAEPAETRLRGVREPVRLYRIREPVPRAATG